MDVFNIVNLFMVRVHEWSDKRMNVIECDVSYVAAINGSRKCDCMGVP